jgi:putative SOS response-associated peptidase YedK
MCGRYAITSAPEAIRRLFAYEDQPNFPARYNVAPTQPVPIVRYVEGKRRFALVRWGLVPSWVKDPRSFSLIINARGESVLDKPAFRAAMRRRRCLFPADGFYEWETTSSRKTPYYVRPKAGGPIAFAGLWETWIGPNGEETESAAIVTTRANRTLARLHERMPVIVPPEGFDFWLNSANIDSLMATALITSADEGLLEAYEVSPAVNRTANESPALLEPVSASQGTAEAGVSVDEPKPNRRPRQQKDDGQASLF